MSFILHTEGKALLAQAIAGNLGNVYIGLYATGWTPAAADTLANVTGELSAHGYTRGLATVTANQNRVEYAAAFVPSGGDIGPAAGWFLCTASAGTTGTLLCSCQFDSAKTITAEETITLYTEAVSAADGAGAAPRPTVYNPSLDTGNSLNDDLIACYLFAPDVNGQDCTTLTDLSGNGLHGTLSGLDPVPPVVVSGAGTTAYNQTYNRVSSYQYTSANGLYKLLYFDMMMCWMLLPIGSDPMMDGWAYYNNSDTAPTAGTWAASTGAAPAPTVTAGSAAAGPWTDDGLQFNGVGYVDLGTSALFNPQVELPPVIVSGSANALLNQSYTRTGTNVWTSADNNYKIQQDYMQWPPAWVICTADYNPMMSTGTAYHNSGQYDTLPSPWMATWTGVTVAQGTVNLQPGDPTGLTIHALMKIGTPATNCHWVSRWASAYAFEKYNGGVAQMNANGVTPRDVVPLLKDQVVLISFVWDGATMRMYRDGVQVTTATAKDSMTLAAGVHTCLGAYLSGGNPASQADDEMRLLVMAQRGHTEAEVKSFANNPYQIFAL